MINVIDLIAGLPMAVLTIQNLKMNLMKKLLILFVVLLSYGSLFAGGLVTNTNQSASFIRNPARDASLGIDAAYYNPAGLVFLQDGFHLSLNNQFISQKRTILSTFPGLNNDEFIGTVTAPLFPSVYAVYKVSKFAFSLSVNPIGGGGSAFFEVGLPSFEQMVAMLPVSLSNNGIPTSQYNFDTEFDGRSLIWGYQANVAYALTDNLSVSLGIRMLSSKNEYSGFLKNIVINPNQPAFGANYNGTNMVSAPVFFSDGSSTLQGWSTGAASYASALQNFVTAGHGDVLLSEGESLGLNATQIAQIQGLILAAHQNPTGVTIQAAQAILNTASPLFASKATEMGLSALLTGDKAVDAIQKGHGFAPVIGLNYNLGENLNLAVRYEHIAKMTLTNETTKDDVNMFPDGAETANDMPANLSVGIGFKPFSKLNLSAGYHLYFDKSANYGKKIDNVFVPNSEVIDKDFWEAAVGLEYELSEKLLLSAGYLLAKTGVNDAFHSDLSHSLSSNSVGIGGRFMVTGNIGVNLGFMTTLNKSYTKLFGTAYKETYKRATNVAALGVDFKF